MRGERINKRDMYPTSRALCAIIDFVITKSDTDRKTVPHFFDNQLERRQNWPRWFAASKIAFQRSRFSRNLIFHNFAKKRQRFSIWAVQICGFLVTFYLKLHPIAIRDIVNGHQRIQELARYVIILIGRKNLLCAISFFFRKFR